MIATERYMLQEKEGIYPKTNTVGQKMKTKVVFRTFIGIVTVDADLTFSMSDEFLKGDVENVREHVKASVSIKKANAHAWHDGHKKYNIDFTLAVHGDIRTLKKQNEEYASKEDNGRHHVDLSTLVVREILIDDKYLRVGWCFADCYGICRSFAGNMYPIREDFDDTNHEDFFCTTAEKLQVYF